ncbi:hypothetical protein N5C46_10515 [Rossellomorea vietnamensis]|uniref:Uncharacterized protein n=1 Tax=Rossellomorea vietnamensis TaxID=218284 RepID=A0ACD4CD60_9BACI|nr:hypothetical protein [Rossellomorea vietnamensis]UXH46448.1 hypothetical protein N5C46_10515 [Rossellomorea vietnamensis]
MKIGNSMKELQKSIDENGIYFINVVEEDRPGIIKAIENFKEENEGFEGETGEQVTVPSCGSAPCNRLVPFRIRTATPFSSCGYESIEVDFAIDACCIHCVPEPCILEGATVTSPCPGEPPITGCEIAVNRVRAVGSLRLSLSIHSTPNCGFGLVTAANRETFCVNNVICYTCTPTPCPDFCQIGIGARSYAIEIDSLGNIQLTIAGFLVLPTCV